MCSGGVRYLQWAIRVPHYTICLHTPNPVLLELVAPYKGGPRSKERKKKKKRRAVYIPRKTAACQNVELGYFNTVMNKLYWMSGVCPGPKDFKYTNHLILSKSLRGRHYCLNPLYKWENCQWQQLPDYVKLQFLNLSYNNIRASYESVAPETTL